MFFRRRPKIASALDMRTQMVADMEGAVVESVRKHGWHAIAVGDDDTADFTYTVGFWVTFGFPEMIIFSAPGELAHEVFWHVERALVFNAPPPINGQRVRLLSGADAVLLPIAERFKSQYLIFADMFYLARGFPAVQVIWPDGANRLPWEPGFDRCYAGDQPDLSEHGWSKTIPPQT